MTVSLSKGGRLSPTKEDPGLDHVMVGLGWDVRATDGGYFDLDASVFLLNIGGKVRSDGDFIFYNKLKSDCGAVEQTDDNRAGEGDDDEAIKIRLSQVPADVDQVVVAVTIHDADARWQNFGMVRNAFVRIANDRTGGEIARYDLTEDYSTETAPIFAEVYRKGVEWRFTPRLARATPAASGRWPRTMG